jgi:peroxiredoxin
MRKTSVAGPTLAAALFLLGGLAADGADQPTVRAPLQSVKDRKPAPAFHLTDASGKGMRLSDYRGKVVLLDFWATECGGCKVEIPFFMEFDRAYRSKGLAVVGVSMDVSYEDLKDAKEGWSRVNPFVREHRLKYPILMGDDQITKTFDINALPATYLIDSHGRIAAVYVGVVDKSDVEANIKALLREHSL